MYCLFQNGDKPIFKRLYSTQIKHATEKEFCLFMLSPIGIKQLAFLEISALVSYLYESYFQRLFLAMSFK